MVLAKNGFLTMRKFSDSHLLLLQILPVIRVTTEFKLFSLLLSNQYVSISEEKRLKKYV